MSRDKGARPIPAIQTKANGDRSEGERAGSLCVEEEEWGSGGDAALGSEQKPLSS